MNKVRAIDLFAGIGGIRKGFENAFGDEMETVFVSEIDAPARATYAANFPTPEIAGDVTKIAVEDVPPFDVCLAGFPCQAFSMAGKRMGFDDDYKGRCRGTLFLEVARLCDFHKPKVVFCENVKGLTNHDKGRTFETIRKTFEEIGYVAFHAVLDSRNFGVPQMRERIYLVCFRKDVAPEKFEFPKGFESNVRLRDVLDPAPIPSKYYLSNAYLESLERHKAAQEAKGNGFGYVIRDLDGIAGTVVCGGMGRERNLIVDERPHSMVPETRIKGGINEKNVRKLTPREFARLQGFEDSFVLPLSDAQTYKQMGNTVTVNVIEAIAEEIRKTGIL